MLLGMEQSINLVAVVVVVVVVVLVVVIVVVVGVVMRVVVVVMVVVLQKGTRNKNILLTIHFLRHLHSKLVCFFHCSQGNDTNGNFTTTTFGP